MKFDYPHPPRTAVGSGRLSGRRRVHRQRCRERHRQGLDGSARIPAPMRLVHLAPVAEVVRVSPIGEEQVRVDEPRVR